jgi:hypothetical protein
MRFISFQETDFTIKTHTADLYWHSGHSEHIGHNEYNGYNRHNEHIWA